MFYFQSRKKEEEFIINYMYIRKHHIWDTTGLAYYSGGNLKEISRMILLLSLLYAQEMQRDFNLLLNCNAIYS